MWLLITFKRWSCIGCFLIVFLFQVSWSQSHFLQTPLLCKASCRTREWRLGGAFCSQPPPEIPFVLQAEALQSTPYVSVKAGFDELLLSLLESHSSFHECFPQAQRVPARKQQAEAARGPASKDSDDHMILAYYETWISFPLMCECCFHSQQQKEKSPRAWNGLHKESLTPDISPCLLWSVES